MTPEQTPFLSPSPESIPSVIRSCEGTIGKLSLSLSEFSTGALTEEHRRQIAQARESYRRWGDITDTDISEDRFDRGDPAGFETKHYHALVETNDNDPVNYHLRATFFSPAELRNPNAPDDIAIWQLLNKQTQETVPVAEALEKFMKKTAVQRIGVLSRFCASPRIKIPDAAATAWAAMQIMITQHNPDVIISTQRHEMISPIFGVANETGSRVVPGFTRTEETIGYGQGWTTRLDETNPAVHNLRNIFPTYWNDTSKKGPFSATMLQNDWRTSNLAVLRAVAKKHP